MSAQQPTPTSQGSPRTPPWVFCLRGPAMTYGPPPRRTYHHVLMAGQGEDADVAAARAAIEERTGRSPERMELIVRYEGRLVCATRLEGRPVVFKAGPGDSIRLEEWVSRALRPLGVRIPAVLVVDTSRGRFRAAQCEAERALGRRGRARRAANADDKRPAVMIETGQQDAPSVAAHGPSGAGMRERRAGTNRTLQCHLNERGAPREATFCSNDITAWGYRRRIALSDGGFEADTRPGAMQLTPRRISIWRTIVWGRDDAPL